MQQSSATLSLHLSFWGLRKIVACSHSSSQCLLVSTVFGTVSSLHPTSFLMIFILVILYIVKCICIPNFIASVSYVAIYAPIIMFGLRLFIEELQCLQCCFHVDIIRIIIFLSTPSGF